MILGSALRATISARLYIAVTDMCTARKKARETVFKAAKERLGTEAAIMLEEFYKPYGESLYAWFASLWDPHVGGFYYSPSARDNDGFLPDIESTVQAMRCISAVGLYEGRGTLYEGTPPHMRESIVRFTRSLQDPCDGYFYHPQWGKNITVSRRGRDLSWSVGILEDFRAKALYPTPLERAAGNESTLPPYLCSRKAFREYLLSFEDEASPYYIRRASYPLGNLLQSQVLQIRAAGEDIVNDLFVWLERLQLENGLWEQTCTYASVNGLMKLTLVYTALGRTMPHLEAALMRAFEAILSKEPCNACVLVYNPWVVVSSLMQMLTKTKEPRIIKFYNELLRKSAADMISATKDKVSVFQKTDGSYSYCPHHSSATSQGARVALPDTNEGDVNATSILSNGTPRSMCAALGIPRVPLFCREDGDEFFRQIQ